MGVPWGIERGKTRHQPTEFYTSAWTRFCEADLCGHFAVPIDDTLYSFRRTDDGAVTVESRWAPELVAHIGTMQCDDGTYDDFEGLFDGYSLFLPDDRGPRRITRGILPWNYSSASSLRDLRGLGGSPLARQLGAAGALAEEHRLVVSISF